MIDLSYTKVFPTVGMFYKLVYDSRKISDVAVAPFMLTVSFKRDCNL